MAEPRKITIVNRHYPPNVDVTGENAWDLANYLIKEHRIDVAIVHIRREAAGGGAVRQPVGKVYGIGTIYEGANKFLRYIAGMIDGYRLIKKAVGLNHGPVIVMTSPPLLPMWASILFNKKKRDWILWSMDLFPEGFAASKQMNESGAFYQWALRNTYAYPPRKIISLGPQQKKALEQKYQAAIPGTTIPCGLFKEQEQQEELPEWKTEPDKIYFGYCGNCGIAHSPEFIKAAIDALDPNKHRFILATYGVKSKDLIDYASSKEGVILLKGVPRKQLQFIDVHLVTLLESWTHVAVPSKAVSSICSGATVLFCGSQESDNWVLLQEAAWHVRPEKMEQDVQQLMAYIEPNHILQKRKKAIEIRERLLQQIEESYARIAEWAV